MTEYITKERAQDFIIAAAHGNGSRLAHMLGKLEDEPPADVAPVVHARWIVHADVRQEEGERPYMTCNACGFYWRETKHAKIFRRCPQCGARMGGGESDE